MCYSGDMETSSLLWEITTAYLPLLPQDVWQTKASSSNAQLPPIVLSWERDEEQVRLPDQHALLALPMCLSGYVLLYTVSGNPYDYLITKDHSYVITVGFMLCVQST